MKPISIPGSDMRMRSRRLIRLTADVPLADQLLATEQGMRLVKGFLALRACLRRAFVHGGGSDDDQGFGHSGELLVVTDEAAVPAVTTHRRRSTSNRWRRDFV